MDKENGETRRPAQKPSAMLYVAALSALFGAIGMGAVLGWTAPAFDSMKQPGSVPLLGDDAKTEKTWIGSSMTLGALFGALISGIFFLNFFCFIYFYNFFSSLRPYGTDAGP